MSAQTDGEHNTVIGFSAFDAADSGESNNVVIGSGAAGAMNTATCDNNVIIGKDAGVGGVATLTACVAIGAASLTATGNIGASDSVFIGKDSGGGSWSTAGCDNNTAVGAGTMAGAMNGAANNVAVGKSALAAITTGDENVAVGSNAGDGWSTQSQNTVVGHHAASNSGAGNITAVGYKALEDCSSDGAVALGHSAGMNITSGAGNTAVGFNSLLTTATGAKNTAIGYEALKLAIDGGDQCTAVGYMALDAANNQYSDKNTAVGSDALGANTSGQQNTGLGANTGATLTTGDACVILGENSDVSTADAQNQIIIGQGVTGQANNSVTLGNADVTAVYMASDSGAQVSCGTLGIGLAAVAPASIVQIRQDVPNIRIDSYNTTAGNASDIQLRRSNHGTLGTHTAVDAADALGKITFMGSDSNSFEVGASIQGFAAETWVNGAEYGTYLTFHTTDIGTATLDERMKIDHDGDITGTHGDYHVSSDERLKKDIVTIPNALDKVLALRGVNFKWKEKDNESLMMGMIAQEVEAIIPEVVHTQDTEEAIKSVEYPFLVGVLVEAVKELSAKVEALENA